MVTEGVAKLDTLSTEVTATGVSLKNGVIPEPEPKSSGVGVGLAIIKFVVIIDDNVTDCDGVNNSLLLLVAFANTSLADGVTNTTLADGVTNTSLAKGVTNTSLADGVTNTSLADGVTNTSLADGVTNTSLADGVTNTSLADVVTNTSVADGVKLTLTMAVVSVGDKSKELVTSEKASVELLMAAVCEGVGVTVTEGVANIEETLPTEGEGVSLKNGLIPEPEPKSSGVGVGLANIEVVIDCEGVTCSVVIAELALAVTIEVLPIKGVGVTIVPDTL